MAETTHAGPGNTGQRTAKVRRFIHSEMRTPVEVQRRNAQVRATQWEPVASRKIAVENGR